MAIMRRIAPLSASTTTAGELTSLSVASTLSSRSGNVANNQAFNASSLSLVDRALVGALTSSSSSFSSTRAEVRRLGRHDGTAVVLPDIAHDKIIDRVVDKEALALVLLELLVVRRG